MIGNRTHNNEDSGIQTYSGGGDELIADNLAYYNGDHGIDDLKATGQRIIGNSVWWNFAAGINVEGSSTGATVENNIAVDNGYGVSPCITPDKDSPTCAPRTHGDIRVDSTSYSGTTVDFNVTWLTNTSLSAVLYVWNTTSYTSLSGFRKTGQGANDFAQDPKWVSASGHDYHLTADSPAIDSANAGVSGEQPVDIDGHPRVDDPATPNTYAAPPGTFDDRGAYELQLSSAPPSDSPPAAALAVTPGSGTAPLAVTADASASSDTDATPISSYGFDFGDGTTVGPQAGATASHTYPSAGTYTVTVTVTDSAGQASQATSQITVSSAPPSDSPPAAALMVTPGSGTAPLAVTADASASSDTDATPISSYGFDFGDGTTVGPQAGATASHTYPSAGTYTVTVTVTDSAGQASQATASVTVASAAGGTNLVKNPGFETDLSGWNTSGNTSVTLTRVTGGRSGAYAAKLTNIGSSTTGCTLNDSPNWVTTTAASGGMYTGSIWVRADATGASLKLRFREYNSSGTLLASPTTTKTLSTAWQQVTVTDVPMAPGASTLDFNAYISSAPPGTCFYADDASITLG